jgi:long-subunit acyl-CoA synthetase (AMP-forming)
MRRDVPRSATIPEQLIAQAADHGCRPAFIWKTRGIWHQSTWTDVLSDTEKAACALAHLGVGSGDHVVFAGASRMGVAFFPVLIAVQWRGAIPVLLPDGLPPEALNAGSLLINPRLLIVAAGDSDPAVRHNVAETATTVVLRGTGAHRHALVERQPGLTLFQDLTAQTASDQRVTRASRSSKDAAAVIFDTATRAHVVTHRELLDSALQIAADHGLGPQDRQFEIVPRSWPAGLVTGAGVALVSGCSIGIGESAETIIDDLREFAPTFAVAPPAFYRYLRRSLYQRSATAGRWSRRLIERSVGLTGPINQKDRKPLLSAVVRGALRGSIGLSRLLVAISLGDQTPTGLAAFMGRLGVRLVHKADIGLGDGVVTPQPHDRIAAIEAELEGSLFIERALVITAVDGAVAALIRPDVTAVSAWSHAMGISIANLETVADDTAVRALIAGEIAALNRTSNVLLDRLLRTFLLATDWLSVASGDLAHDGTLQRDAALARHADAVGRLRTGDGLPVEKRAPAQSGATDQTAANPAVQSLASPSRAVPEAVS